MTVIQVLSMMVIALWVTVTYIAYLLYVIKILKEWEEKRKNRSIKK